MLPEAIVVRDRELEGRPGTRPSDDMLLRADAMHANPEVFDPFHDRVSRDIRNTLSEAFVAVWQGNGEDYHEAASALRKRHHHPLYRRYIDGRLSQYRAVLAERCKLTDPILLDEVRLLWNRELFFEVHELLESHWHAAEGERRATLQALILAAAVYVHREAGRTAAAEKLGRRACDRLDALRAHLTPLRNLDALCKALRSPEGPPPKLERHAR